MISICIPIYNFNVVDLVNRLSAQSKSLNIPSEIILIDDSSEDNFRKLNEDVCSKHNYIQLESNIGRAAIRNKFLNYAKYDNLLFLDCDSIVSSDHFLADYFAALKKYPGQLICGGRDFPQIPPKRSEMLRWKYGVNKESKPYEERKENPNISFMTNNFLISKKIFKTIQFDERIVDYGHEDTLFGFELRKRNIHIIHIDNPILNGDLESNKQYLKNTETAISNLVRIIEYVDYDRELIEDITLLRFYYRIYKLRIFLIISFVLVKPAIRYFLSKGYVSLFLFDFYKLGTLALKMNAKQK